MPSVVPLAPARPIDGAPTWTVHAPDHDGYLAQVGATVVLANGEDSLAQSVHALTGHGGNLAGARKLTAPRRTGIFMFVTIGNDLMDEIQKSTHAKLMQLPMTSVEVDLGETGRSSSVLFAPRWRTPPRSRRRRTSSTA